MECSVHIDIVESVKFSSVFDAGATAEQTKCLFMALVCISSVCKCVSVYICVCTLL